MGLVAEKTGQVRGNRIEHELQLFPVPDQEGIVFADMTDLFFPETFLESTFEYRTVCGRECNSAFIVDELAILVEIGIA